MDTSDEIFMRLAIEEAWSSLRQGNHGFGAVIVRGGTVLARAHDTEETEGDPTAHAEMNAIRYAARILGKSLEGCTLVSTHEPCPMCAAAAAWARLGRLVFGTSTRESLRQGRRRMDLACGEVFLRAQVPVQVERGVLQGECDLLYRQDVRWEIERLRAADEEQLCAHDAESTRSRLEWFRQDGAAFLSPEGDPLESAYRLLLARLQIRPEQAPIVQRDEKKIVFHSQNFCPTLEACRILGLETRRVCRLYNEQSTRALVRQIDPRLDFSRNYDRLRPEAGYCEEMIFLAE